ncbi:hypothetical protein [Zhongshania sp.]|uniref:hypothetical protein n=1 Tax=Zhongshania sp. TaxID=1971902 RepID=UPI001B5BF745|nr:hypothetical protein [Zhongshania sp.]MBQ0795761.1 hypothetical protein [Zhongshania sp.]
MSHQLAARSLSRRLERLEKISSENFKSTSGEDQLTLAKMALAAEIRAREMLDQLELKGKSNVVELRGVRQRCLLPFDVRMDGHDSLIQRQKDLACIQSWWDEVSELQRLRGK